MQFCGKTEMIQDISLNQHSSQVIHAIHLASRALINSVEQKETNIPQNFEEYLRFNLIDFGEELPIKPATPALWTIECTSLLDATIVQPQIAEEK